MDPTKGLKHINFMDRPDSAATVATSPQKHGMSFNKTQTPLNIRTSPTFAGEGPYNPHQVIPGGFTRHGTVFANVLQDHIRAGFPSKNFQRMNNARTRETILQLHRDMSMATTGVDTAASFYRTAGPRKDRPLTAAHQRAQSVAQGFAKSSMGPLFAT